MNIKLDSKTLLEDNAQFRNSKNHIRIRIDLEFDFRLQKLRALVSII